MLTNADEFALDGPSNDPNPKTHAFRKDLADVALAGTVIASHYAAPVARRLAVPSTLRAEPRQEADAICELAKGDRFEMLDDSLGWAWGYAGAERRVGYVRSDTLAR